MNQPQPEKVNVKIPVDHTQGVAYISSMTTKNTSLAGEQTHTPTPWRLGKDARNIMAGTGDETHTVASTREGLYNSQAEPNAAFIIRACNAHEDMVKALRILVREIGTSPTLTAAISDTAFNAVNAAIAKAEGRAK